MRVLVALAFVAAVAGKLAPVNLLSRLRGHRSGVLLEPRENLVGFWSTP